MSIFALVVLATVGALLGSGIALLTNWVLAEMRRFDAGVAALERDLDRDHEWISYSDYRFCSRCGLREARVRGGAL